ncbi:MAG: hypothetical protein KAG99_01165 [Bacteroidales bacterium]|nr:hypothetical protein [Bacteroidales bacterium]
MKVNKIITALPSLLIALLILISGSLHAQVVDKNSEDAKKNKTEVKVETPEQQKKEEKQAISVKEKQKVQQRKKEQSRKGSQGNKTGTKQKKENSSTLEERGEIRSLKGDRAKETEADISGSVPVKTTETPLSEKNEKPSDKNIEKAPSQKNKSLKKTKVKPENVEQSKIKATENVKETENTIQVTEEKIIEAKKKIETAKIRLREQLKNGEITQEKYDEKQLRISEIENMIADFEKELKAEQTKIDKNKGFVDKP